MSRKIALGGLNGSSMRIINTIRQNASAQYQDLIPEVKDLKQLNKVGDVLYGNPALSNEFISALMNRIALVVVKSANHVNRYQALKKGDIIDYGETIEEVFVELAKGREINIEQSARREFQRTIPEVKAAFHIINWRVQYPITVDGEQLKRAFLSESGVTDFIERVISSIYDANEYDEELLFKYLLIKGIVNGKMHPVSVEDMNDANAAGIVLRSMSNRMTFLSPTYNEAGVRTKTLKEDQYIFMDADYEAKYGFDILMKAYNLTEGELKQKLFLVDDWTEFDNERFDVIRQNSDQIEEVTSDELSVMDGVVAVIIDKEWLQVYDNLTKLTENYVASGDYHNYYLFINKTVSSSPFANAVVVADETAPVLMPASIKAEITAKSVEENATSLAINIKDVGVFGSENINFVTTQDSVEKGIAIEPYGEVIFPTGQTSTTLEVIINSVKYTASAVTTTDDAVGTEITLAK